jgi:hypothetical protein
MILCVFFLLLTTDDSVCWIVTILQFLLLYLIFWGTGVDFGFDLDCYPWETGSSGLKNIGVLCLGLMGKMKLCLWWRWVWWF